MTRVCTLALLVCLFIINQPHFPHANAQATIRRVTTQFWGYYDSWPKLNDIKDFCTPSSTLTTYFDATVQAQFDGLFSTATPPILTLTSSWLPPFWAQTSSLCNSFSQSPINIRYKFSKYKRSYKKIVVTMTRNPLSTSANSAEAWNIDNIDHTLVLTPAIDLKTAATAAGAAAVYEPRYDYFIDLKPDSERYKLKRIVFRWPTSEHLYNSKRYAMEAQLEFELGTQKAIIAYFFKLSDTDNPDLAIITDNLAKVITEGPRTPADPSQLGPTQAFLEGLHIPFRFSQLFPTTLKKYFRYSGSLTYPPCDQNVKWIVARSPVLKVSLKQIQLFQDLKFRYVDHYDHTTTSAAAATPPVTPQIVLPTSYWCQFNILTNVRPVQRRNDRKVFRSFKNKPRKREGEGEA